MPPHTGYLRSPSIAGGTVVFVTEDDLWSVGAAGGVARRLTAGLAEASHPALSPDGALIAFTSREEHHPEVWVMPAGGGPARRLTWLGANTATRGWLPDGRILATSDAGRPFANSMYAYGVAPGGGPVEALAYGPVREVAYGPGGAVVLGRNTADPARWKRYRGGTAGELWIDPDGSGEFRRLITLPGNLASPMWSGARVWFLSDHEGIGNLYSCTPEGDGLARHTDHDEYYARLATTDGARIVYQCGAELWLHDPATDRGGRIEVDLASPRVQRNRRFVPAPQYLTGATLHPAGHSVAVETRGKLFSFPLWEQAVRQHGRPDGVRYRLARWVGDGSSVAVVSDEGGEDAVEVHVPARPEENRRLEGLDLGCVTGLAASPAGHHVAVTNHRHELSVVDLQEGTARLVDHSPSGGLDGPVWSPDGRWLAYSFAASRQTRSIKLCEVASGETTMVTGPEFRDVGPAFDPEGRYLYFLSYRTFDPVGDNVYFDLGFPKAVRPYLVTLQAGLPSPFVPLPRALGGGGKDDEHKGDEGKDRDKDDNGGAPEATVVDLEGIGGRVVAFPVPEGRYSRLAGIPGKVLWAASPVEGSLGRSWADLEPSAHARLESWDLAEHKVEVLVEGISWFTVSKDGRTLLYAAGRRLRALKAGEKPAEGVEREPPGRKSGWLDLDRVKVSVDPGAEWRQMYGEAWRLQRDHFWVADMSGVDWHRVHDRYLPLVDKVATRLEFSDLMWEMQGELGTSHAYEFGGDHRPAPAYAMGHLGADLSLDAKGRWRFDHIVEGDGWEATAGSPLLGPGIDVHQGDTLLEVGGRAVGPELAPAQLLVHRAGQAVELTVGGPKGKAARTVVVTTLADERPARYREWVRANRRVVHEAGGGRVGYVHVPDMGPRGYAEFHRGYLAEVERDALVVDVRNNGGGNVSQLLLEKLARRRLGYDVPRWAPAEPYPSDSPTGPMVCLTNELAGSDGDIFTHCFKLLGLGPVVGKRTWGGVIGISPTHQLVDGSLTTQPEYAFWFTDVGWGVENHGSDPDHDVDIRPQDWAAGRDPQLERALDLVLGALGSWHPVVPDPDSRPRLALPVLPPRLAEGR